MSAMVTVDKARAARRAAMAATRRRRCAFWGSPRAASSEAATASSGTSGRGRPCIWYQIVPHSIGTAWYRSIPHPRGRAGGGRDDQGESAVNLDDLTHVHVAIIGSGFSGLGAAIRLKQEGIDDFVVLERSDEVGGTWRDNTYPGCACDVPSHLYSFSFAPNPDWTRDFSPQPEIFSYLRSCASRYGVIPHIRFGHAVTNAAWDEDAQKWRIEAKHGTTTVTITADVMVGAAGALSEPAVPKLPGLEKFEGQVFPSARWDHDADLAGRKVAVVGTGASAIQVVPEIQPKVGKLSVFQRTPPWIMPRRN